MAEISLLVGPKHSGKTAILLQQNYNLKKVFDEKVILANCGSDKCSTSLGATQSAVKIARATSLLLLKPVNEWKETEYFLIDNAHLLTPLQVHEIVALADDYNVEFRLAGRKHTTEGKLFKGIEALIEVCDNMTHAGNSIICSCGMRATHELPDSDELVCRKHFNEAKKSKHRHTKWSDIKGQR